MGLFSRKIDKGKGRAAKQDEEERPPMEIIRIDTPPDVVALTGYPAGPPRSQAWRREAELRRDKFNMIVRKTGKCSLHSLAAEEAAHEVCLPAHAGGGTRN